MNDNQIMMSAAMLEAMWECRRKDMIDLITPFVMYAIGSSTSVGEVIDIEKVQEYVQHTYAYSDIPEIIIEKVLQRQTNSIKKEDHEFYLVKPIDTEIAQMNARRKECKEYLDKLGLKLSQYLNSHCKRKSNFSKENAIEGLHGFFARYGLQVGTNNWENTKISAKDYEADYYILNMLFLVHIFENSQD